MFCLGIRAESLGVAASMARLSECTSSDRYCAVIAAEPLRRRSWQLLVIVAIQAGHKSRRPEAVLDAAEKAFGNAAYAAFEGAKKGRAAKRRERLGLPME